MNLTHVDARGRAVMVDITDKPRVERRAEAVAEVRLSARARQLIQQSRLPKGDPFEVARVAGIQAAKSAARLIPLCHDLPLDFVDVDIELGQRGWLIRTRVATRWSTGVEMEALTAAAAAALTLYDMTKAVDKEMVIEGIRLVSKTRGEAP